MALASSCLSQDVRHKVSQSDKVRIVCAASASTRTEYLNAVVKRVPDIKRLGKVLTDNVLIVAMARNAKTLRRLPIMLDAVDIDARVVQQRDGEITR